MFACGPADATAIPDPIISCLINIHYWNWLIQFFLEEAVKLSFLYFEQLHGIRGAVEVDVLMDLSIDN